METTNLNSTMSNVNEVAETVNKVVENTTKSATADKINTTNKADNHLLNAVVTNVGIKSGKNGIIYRLTFDRPFKAFVIRNKQQVETNVNYIDYPANQLLNTIELHVANFEYPKSKIADRCAAINVQPQYYELIHSVLIGAEMIIDRTPFCAGEEFIDENGESFIHARDGYKKQIMDITVTAEVAALLAKSAPKAINYLKELLDL